MDKVGRNIIKKISILCALLLVCASLAACSSAPEAKGVYRVESIDFLSPPTKNIIDFDSHKNNTYEIRLESGRATSSYIYCEDMGNNTYRALPASAVTTWKRKGSTVTLAGTLGVGTVDLRLEEGWLLLTYTIDKEPIYFARYKKVVDN